MKCADDKKPAGRAGSPLPAVVVNQSALLANGGGQRTDRPTNPKGIWPGSDANLPRAHRNLTCSGRSKPSSAGNTGRERWNRLGSGRNLTDPTKVNLETAVASADFADDTDFKAFRTASLFTFRVNQNSSRKPE